MRIRYGSSILAFVLSVGLVGSAFANFVTLNVQWSGQSFGNSASATGFITFDDTFLPEVGVQSNLPLPSSAVTGLGISIAGSSSGNGTFGMRDFGSFFFSTPSPLNFGTELIGQSLSNGSTFGTSTGTFGNGLGGDFNLFASSAFAPTGTYYFQLTTAGGDNMLVTSMHPVPEPETYAMLLAGLGLLGVAVRRIRQKAAA